MTACLAGIGARAWGVLAALCAVLWAAAAFGHGAGFTREENDWLNRQRALDGTKCCDQHDAHVGEGVDWRMRGGQYEVRVNGSWHTVPPERLMRSDPGDPSPWGSAALLFYTPHPNFPNGFMLWCFRPGILL